MTLVNITPWSANDKYRSTLRSTWIASPADTSLLVRAVPTNVPTIVVVGWNTDYETIFTVTGVSGTDSSNYALTGATRVRGANANIPENTAVNCLNNEEFFNQYGTTINEVIDAVNAATEAVDGVVFTTTKYGPQGYLLNGKIVPSVTSNNITVAIKGMDGNDPSVSNPVYCRIGDTVRSITAALSVTKNAGTNWFNSGSATLATNEIDYFVYLGYNATDGVVLGFARIPHATKYGDFSATSTSDRYCAISTITTAAATDYYELIGRFAATLSATASFNWSVPTYTALNLVQRPIFETRPLTATPTWTGFGSAPSADVYKYLLRGSQCFLNLSSPNGATSNATSTTLVAPIATSANGFALFDCMTMDNTAYVTGGGYGTLPASSSTITFQSSKAGAGWTASGTKRVYYWNAFYNI